MSDPTRTPSAGEVARRYGELSGGSGQVELRLQN